MRYDLFQSHPQTYIRIFDVNGRQIQSFTLSDNYEGQVLWDTRNEKPGMYFYQLWQNEEKVHADKIVVQHYGHVGATLTERVHISKIYLAQNA